MTMSSSVAKMGLPLILLLSLLVSGSVQQEAVSSYSTEPSRPLSAKSDDAGRPEFSKPIPREHCRATVSDKNGEEVTCPSMPPSFVEGPPKEGDGEAQIVDTSGYRSPGKMLRQGMEDFVDRMEQSRAKVMKQLGGVMDHMVHSRDQMMERFDQVMDQFSESMSDSRTKVIQGFDSVMDKMSESKKSMMKSFDGVMVKMTESKDSVMKGIDDVIDKVAHSQMMAEIDHVIDKVSHSKVMEEIRALPEEIRQSFVLSARNRSYAAAGVMVAVATAVLVLGAIYYSWCHHDAWGYYLQPLHGDQKLMCIQHPSSSQLLVGYAKVPSDLQLDNLSQEVTETEEGSSEKKEDKEAISVDGSGTESSGASPSTFDGLVKQEGEENIVSQDQSYDLESFVLVGKSADACMEIRQRRKDEKSSEKIDEKKEPVIKFTLGPEEESACLDKDEERKAVLTKKVEDDKVKKLLDSNGTAELVKKAS